MRESTRGLLGDRLSRKRALLPAGFLGELNVRSSSLSSNCLLL
jgi:hypothetical protein